MILEDCVPNRSLCEKWKSIGGRQDTVLAYRLGWDDKWHLTQKCHHEECYPECGQDWVAAPLVSELMEWMKAILDISSTIEEWEIVLFASAIVKRDKSLPNALMQMAIELEEKK